jgi:aspartyl aminopeptidase
MKKHVPATHGAVILDRDRARARALDLCRYVDASPMPYQASAESVRRLREAGYSLLREGDAWDLEPGRGYFVTRADTTVIAFRVGKQAPSATGFSLVGAHIDSPNLRVKPNADGLAAGYWVLGVDVYGGAILASWPDRDLGLAGRVVLRSAKTGAQRTALVEIRRPIARVSNLAIHLNRKINDDGLKLDKQRHLPPMLGLDDTAEGEAWSLRELLGREIGVGAGEIVTFDLGLFDVQPSTLGGLHEEFVFAPRLDNLGSSHAGLSALCAATSRTRGAPETTWILALYDHEECGSQSHQGAMGTVLRDVMSRLAAAHPKAGPNAAEEAFRAMARSFLISADMAHAVHPNYSEVHEPDHRPYLNRGPVIKRNDNQRYATDGDTGARFVALCREAGFEPQVFVNRSDLPCGTTIGPIAAAASGVSVVDVGNPMLSMHSIRECCGTWDADLMIEAMARHFR